jgi:hypothetical protein
VDAAFAAQRQPQLHAVQRRSRSRFAAAAELAFEGKGARVDETAVDVEQAVVATEAAADDAARVHRLARGGRRQEPAAVAVGVQVFTGGGHGRHRAGAMA